MPAVFAAGSPRGIESSSTTVSTTIPVEAVDGSLIVACVMRRSGLTPPAGWTLAVSQQHDDYAQWVDIYYKEASSDAGTSPVWTQASSGRFILHYQVYTGGGASTLEGVNSDTTLLGPLDVPALTATSNCITVNAVSCVFTATNNTFSYTGMTPTLPVSASDNRLGAAYHPTRAGESFFGTVNDVSTEPNMAAVTAQFSFADGVFIPPSDARVDQTPTLALVDTVSDPRVSQAASMVLWGVSSTAVVDQTPVFLLVRIKGRRTIGITD